MLCQVIPPWYNFRSSQKSNFLARLKKHPNFSVFVTLGDKGISIISRKAKCIGNHIQVSKVFKRQMYK